MRWTVLFAAIMLPACNAPPPGSSSPVLNSPQPVQVSPLPQPPMRESEAANSPPARAAKAALAKQLVIDVASIRVLSVEEVEWPDGCLGLAKPDQMCTQVIVPGYRVLLEVNGTQYEVRTDQTAQQVGIATVGRHP